jgi:hypothetical protein
VTNKSDEVLREAKQLLSLNERTRGGPYMGYAAERFVLVMAQLVAELEKANQTIEGFKDMAQSRAQYDYRQMITRDR